MRRSQGFTLLEIMIVVAIIGILAAVAVPQYQNYVRQSRVTIATSVLSAMRVSMEQYFQDNRSYAGACAPGTVAPTPGPAPNATSPSFTFSCAPAPTLTTYTVTATGLGPMAGFIYTINEQNVRATLGTGPWGVTNATCWIQQKGGNC